MKFAVTVIALLSISTSWALKVNKAEDKDKREAPLGYPSSSHGYQAQSQGHGDASAISIGAGYSVGGAKPSYGYSPEASGLQLSSEGLQGSGHGNVQLSPITLQPSQGYGSNDLQELMSQLTHGLNTGAISLSPYQQGGHGQEMALPQFTYAAPQLQQYASEQPISSVPSYAAGTKGLGSYSTGPVLFNPADSHGNQAALAYSSPSSGHAFADASGLSLGGAGGHSFPGFSLGSGHSFGGSGLSLGGAGHSLGGAGLSLGGAGHSLGGAGLSLGGAGHSLGGARHSLGGAGHSLGGAGLSLGGAGHSLGGSGHSFGGSGHSFGGAAHSLGGSGHSLGGPYKSLGGSYTIPSKVSFKPSAYLGSGHGDSSHGLSSLSGAYSGAPSFSSHSSGHGPSFGSGGHGVSFGGFGGGSTKFAAPSYSYPKGEGFGSLDTVASFASGGHGSSPPATNYGTPSGSYGQPSTAAHAASSHTPQYYVMSKYPSSFGEGSSSYRAPSSGHSSLNSYSSGPKYSFSGHSPSSRYGAPKDSHGAHSETSYNTIKYSQELKPRVH